MTDPVRVLVVGLGNMGASHASAYHRNPGFEIVGLCTRTIRSKALPDTLSDYPLFEDYEAALAELKPDAVSINTWPNTHADYALKAMDAGAHVFMEKPIGTTNAEAEAVVAKARETNRKLVLGYILRVHPSWIRFIELGRTMGKPLVMRLNLNQQSSGDAWFWHKDLIDSLTPIVDCGVHYVDVMCQLTGAKPLRVHGIGARLWDAADKQNYGHLHVTFDDGSVGWYEAGWGPMMSETAFFVKDIVGPKGSVSLVPDPTAATDKDLSDSADIDKHTKTDAIRVHHADVGADKTFTQADEILSMEDEPDHQQLCDREQDFFLKAIREDLDLGESMDAAVNSLRIVLAAEESIAKEQVVRLD
ncbi:Gfo/Idh/MocA family protein [Roseisalinus antarcticus]|uniref:Putative oxidoreductase YcjS n=1 Tax=Roseisalinus antarcticus TaxID=254357 RepID=A0A1Y5SZE1_9RHOB|nr:Gfo/Idh/MocA family oxidoreductase [Roseisalinus antarcticus]SLN52455.1 putative oxidoreductase YcjS [Roseisalinus antarcticus]